MAGYIMTIGSDEYIDFFYTKSKSKRKKWMESSESKGIAKAKRYALEQCFRDGVYSARCADSGSAFLGTLADYLGMKENDDIFFFMERKIYGIGKLINVRNVDCRFRVQPKNPSSDDLIETKNPELHPFLCVFKPNRYFFREGIDMDEVMILNPDKIQSLRFFSQKTFIKLDDIESEAIKNCLARKNEAYLDGFDESVHYPFADDVHKRIEMNLRRNSDDYSISVFDYIKYKNKKGNVSSEYYLEGAIMDLLRNYESEAIGKWDFIGRQYPASPPKPSEYVEIMDLFGYRYVPGYKGAISKYVVIELKVGTINKDAVQQTMKYVDWISREYTKGNYSMVEAYTIGFDQEENLEDEIKDIVDRNYIIESRPVRNEKWDKLRILSYCTLLRELANKEGRSVDD